MSKHQPGSPAGSQLALLCSLGPSQPPGAHLIDSPATHAHRDPTSRPLLFGFMLDRGVGTYLPNDGNNTEGQKQTLGRWLAGWLGWVRWLAGLPLTAKRNCYYWAVIVTV